MVWLRNKHKCAIRDPGVDCSDEDRMGQSVCIIISDTRGEDEENK